ncbi:hypothetical protein QEN42_21130 [Gordonia alkanivorans]|uniref:hypothetical protein n=1 Tax=Gordonia alkanivorans TaxID=84096 RepID=UPI00244A25E3|nr:hypothetical protein [Gordonia alkanivorans]MDH3052338.1 hypothetical protein [Gordonia alkanivorans]
MSAIVDGARSSLPIQSGTSPRSIVPTFLSAQYRFDMDAPKRFLPGPPRFLKVECRLNMDSPKAAQTHRMLSDGRLGEMSFCSPAWKHPASPPGVVLLRPDTWEAISLQCASGSGTFDLGNVAVGRVAQGLHGVPGGCLDRSADEEGLLLDMSAVRVDTDTSGVRVKWALRATTSART